MSCGDGQGAGTAWELCGEGGGRSDDALECVCAGCVGVNACHLVATVVEGPPLGDPCSV